jgi:hypothetical protein
LGPGFPVIQKAEMLVPWDIDEELEVDLVSQVEEPFWGRVIDAQEVRTELLADNLEVAAGPFSRGKGESSGIRRERSIGHTLNVELTLADPDELAVHARTWS